MRGDSQIQNPPKRVLPERSTFNLTQNLTTFSSLTRLLNGWGGAIRRIAKLKRDFPEIAERMEQGGFKSVIDTTIAID